MQINKDYNTPLNLIRNSNNSNLKYNYVDLMKANMIPKDENNFLLKARGYQNNSLFSKTVVNFTLSPKNNYKNNNKNNISNNTNYKRSNQSDLSNKYKNNDSDSDDSDADYEISLEKAKRELLSKTYVNDNNLNSNTNIDIKFLKKANDLINVVQEQNACREIQSLITKNPEIVETLIIPKIKNDYRYLSNHKFANYLIQMMLQYMSENSIVLLYNSVSCNIYNFIFNSLNINSLN